MKVKFTKPKELVVKISHYRRTRNVRMADLPEHMRLRMAANGLEFNVSFPDENTKEGESVRAKIEKGAYDHTTGLYSIVVDEDSLFDEDRDEYLSQMAFSIRFAEHDDLVSFEKNFMLLLKLES